jgi:glycosyl transferase, family 25
VLPVLFINLDRDARRREQMQAQAHMAGVTLHRIEAVLWNALPAAEHERLYSASLNRKQYHQSLVAGEKGCYASHLKAWQWLLDSEHGAAVVLEDDVRMEPEFAKVVAAIEAMPAGWDMVKLIGRAGMGKREKAHDSTPLVGHHRLVGYRRIPNLAAAYAISRAGATKLLASRQPFGRPVDVDMRYWWENDVRVQGVQPDVVSLDDTSQASSIGSKQPSDASAWRKLRIKLAYTAHNWWASQHPKA